MLKKKEEKAYAEDPPWSESNKNTDYYHCYEYKELQEIRASLEHTLKLMRKQRAHYDLSAVLIPEAIVEQMKALTDNIWEEEMTRTQRGAATERSFIALKALGTPEPKPEPEQEEDTEEDTEDECPCCGEPDSECEAEGGYTAQCR